MEEKIRKAENEAASLFESLLPDIRKAFTEAYMKGFMKGLESAECEETATVRLKDESDALAGGAVPIDGAPLVRLKKDAILKKKLRRKEFSTRTWKTFVLLDIKTLGDILQVSERFYLNQRNFGTGSLNEIRLYVKKYGYELKEK